MKVCVDDFVEAAREVLAGFDIEIQEVRSPATQREESALIVSVGILGDVTGTFLLFLDEDTAGSIVGSMFDGMGVTRASSRNATVRAEAIGEMANQICGHAVTNLSQRGLRCDITPPAVLSGTHAISSLTGAGSFEVRRMTGDFGSLLLALGVEPSTRQ